LTKFHSSNFGPIFGNGVWKNLYLFAWKTKKN